jgi:hypothetical protein
VKFYRPRALFVGVLIVLLGVAGCSDVSGQSEEPAEPPRVMSVDAARAEIRGISTGIREATGISGQVDDNGPGVSTCADDPERNRLFLMRHPWAIYGVPRETLEEGMDGLRRELPEQGWEIVEDRVLDTPDRTPEMLIETRDGEYGAIVNIEGGGDDPRLVVSLSSVCFSTPEGESPRREV